MEILLRHISPHPTKVLEWLHSSMQSFSLSSLIPADGSLPLWIKVAYTAFVLALIPIYWKEWGPANFLWFSDVALFVCMLALWLESKLLASMMAVGVLLPELYWSFELLFRLLTGRKLAGLTSYIFNNKYPLPLRLLSLFHLVLPAVIILMLCKFGYKSAALYYQTPFAWLILFLCYKLTPPSANINWVFGLGKTPQHRIPSRFFLVFIMLAYPILLFLPTHFLLKMLF